MIKKHIIFDLDGTLSDTAKATSSAINEIAKRHNIPLVDYKLILEAMGLPGLEFYAHLYPDMPKEELLRIEPLVDDAEEQAIKQLGGEILFPGVYDMLAKLYKKGLQLYIASTGSKNHVQVTLEASGVGKFFSGVSCGQPTKISMLKNMVSGRDVNEWIMVGDMYKDSEAARASNMLALGAGFGYLTKQAESLFDYVLRKPEDIYDYL